MCIRDRAWDARSVAGIESGSCNCSMPELLVSIVHSTAHHGMGSTIALQSEAAGACRRGDLVYETSGTKSEKA